MSLSEQIDKSRLPEHIAIIMDGNGRWAQNVGMERIFGHKSGVNAVKDVVEGAAKIGIKYLTLYTFSAENWNRPTEEVDALMELLVNTMSQEKPTLLKNKIELNAIGDLGSLPKSCVDALMDTKAATSKDSKMVLTLALSYSAREEILRAAKNIAQDYKDDKLELNQVDDQVFSQYLYTKDIPDPELLVRTSGEFRLSNYLLWQIAYTEFYFTEKLWPDFASEDLFEAIINFQKRERRFGKTSQQIKQ
jgi:undecaprenyl diphosphate synthase